VWPVGSHPLERGANGQQWRWTRERLALPAGTRLVVIDTCPQPPVYGMQPADATVTPLTSMSLSGLRFRRQAVHLAGAMTFFAGSLPRF